MIAPDLPWQPERTRPVIHGRVVVRLASGEAPERIPHVSDVARGALRASLRVDGGGGVDRILAKHSPASRVMRVHSAATNVGTAGRMHLGWDDVEERLGLSRTLTIDVDPDASLMALIEDLRAVRIVESVSACYVCVTPFETAERAPHTDPWWGHRMIGAAEALGREPGDSALIVGIIDSGVIVDHPELSGRTRPGMDTVDLPRQQMSRGLELVGDSTKHDRDPSDEMGHGTGCAGIVGASGLRLPKGLGGAARLLPIRVLAAARRGPTRALTAIGAVPDIDRGLKTAIDLGARVLNLSFGTPASSLRDSDPPPHGDVVAYARARGCVLVAASGNSGKSERYYPSCLDGVIAVGSVGPGAHPSRFTTRGDHVDLCAPGERIPTTGLQGYRLQTGTSFAAPFVTGAAALLAAVCARYGVAVDGGRIRDVLMRTSRAFPAGVDSKGCGAGVLDVPAALAALHRELAAEAIS